MLGARCSPGMNIGARNRIKVAQSIRFNAARKGPFTVMLTAG